MMGREQRRHARQARGGLLLEQLELRQYLSGALAPADTDILPRVPGMKRAVAVQAHPRKWYKAAGTATVPASMIWDAMALGRGGTAGSPVEDAGGFAQPALVTGTIGDTVSYSVNAAGLPLLTSRPGSSGLKVFLDFDGYNTDTPFDTDGDSTTFSTAEQATIYACWRDVVSFLSMFDVNVTTVQPATGGGNPVFVWQRIVGNLSGGAAYVGWLTSDSSQGYNNSGDAVSRHSGIAHEIGHQLNLNHQSDYDNLGGKTNEYSSGWDSKHGPIMGVDYAQWVHKWIIGRNTLSADTFQDDITAATSFIATKIGGTGYMPDDFTGSSFATASPLSLTRGSYQAMGSIERVTDADYFSFVSTGQVFNVNAEPAFESALAPKLELYDANGVLIASRDDTVQRGGDDNASEEFTLTLPAGTYYAKVMSHGDYGDVGEYTFFASPLPDGWASVDVRNTATGRGGYVTYDDTTGTFYQGGSGADVWTNTDAFRFTYQVLNGTGSIIAQVTGLDNTDASAKAGLMIRESLAYNSKFAMINFKPSGSQYVYRTTNGGTAASGSAVVSVPNWIQLTRSGNLVVLRQSFDGVVWAAAGTVTLSNLANQVYIGLVTNSHNVDRLANSSFTNVTLTGQLGAIAPSFNTLVPPSGLAGAPVATQSTAMSLSWVDTADETGYSVERSLDGVNWTQVGTTGADVTTYTDNPGFGAMRWWYRVAANDTAGKSAYSNVISVVNKPVAPASAQAITMTSSKVSMMWRDVSGDTGYRVERSTDGGANYTTVTTTAANFNAFTNTGLAGGTLYTYRITPTSAAGDGVPLVLTAQTATSAATNFRFTAKSATAMSLAWTDLNGEQSYNLERSTDKSTWASIATLPANSTSYVDTTVTALNHYYYRLTGVIGSTVGDAAVIYAATPPAAAAASPFVDADINNPTGAGAGYIIGRDATVVGGGTRISNTSDTFHYLYRQMTGNGEVIVHVAGFDGINTLSKAGILIRNTLAANSAFADVVYEPSTTDFMYRTTAGGGATTVAGTTTGSRSWLRLVRSGNTFTGYYSHTGAANTWVTIGSANITMGSTVYVGLAVTAQDDGYLAKGVFDNFTVSDASNAAPTVAAAAAATPSPVNGTSTALSILGADDGNEPYLIYNWVASGPGAVTYSANGTNAAKNTTATFTVSGTYQFTATIADLGKLQTTSSVTVNVTVPLPGAPSNVTAVPASPTGVNVAWNAVSGAASYTVWRSTSTRGPYTVAASGLTGTAFADTGLTPETIYYYVVSATNATGEGPESAEASAMPSYLRTRLAFNEAAGSGAADSTGNGWAGTLVNGPTFAAGKINNAVNLDGTNDYVSLGSGVLNGMTDFTVAAWVNLDTISTWARVFDFGTGQTVNMFLTPRGGSNVVRFAITTGGGGAEQQINGLAALPTGVWTHVAVTWTGNVGIMYVNGVEVGRNASMTLNASSLGTTTQNYIGKSQYGDPYLDGRVDDFRILTRALTAEEVLTLAQTNLPGTPGAVVATPGNQLVGLTWTPAPGAASYTVQRALVSGGPYAAVASNITGTSYVDANVSNNTTYYYTVVAVNQVGVSGSSSQASALPVAPSSVAGRYLFYSGSGFDGADHAGAIAPDKSALLPGQTASFGNYSSYSRGINGVMVDIAGLPGTLAAADFVFRVGNGNDTSSWVTAAAPISVVTLAGQGAGGSTRVVITWADNAIAGTWLQVTVKGGVGKASALPADDVFYFGNAIGETGCDPATARVDVVDQLHARARVTDAALLTDASDFNRDGVVDSVDEAIARENGTWMLSELKLIALPGGPAAEAALPEVEAEAGAIMPAFGRVGIVVAGPITPALVLPELNLVRVRPMGTLNALPVISR